MKYDHIFTKYENECSFFVNVQFYGNIASFFWQISIKFIVVQWCSSICSCITFDNSMYVKYKHIYIKYFSITVKFVPIWTRYVTNIYPVKVKTNKM